MRVHSAVEDHGTICGRGVLGREHSYWIEHGEFLGSIVPRHDAHDEGAESGLAGNLQSI